MLEPEDAGGPRGVSGRSRRIAETGPQSAPRRGGRFQPADRAAQCNGAPPPCSPPVHPRPSIATTGLGFQGRRTIDLLSQDLAADSASSAPGRRPVGPFRPSPVSLVLATWTEDCVAGLTIDHIALSQDLAADSLGVISNLHQDGDLSDHFALVAGLRRSLWSWRRGPRTAWPPPVTWASRDRSPPTWASTAGLRSLPERVRGRCRMPGSSRNGYADCRQAGANGPTIHAATRRCTSSSEHCPRPRCSP